MSSKCKAISTNSKDTYFQMWRGICIIAVVLIHCHSISVNLSALDGIYYLFERNIINFPVALFFVLSGYFTKKESFNKDRVKNTIKSRTIKLLVPYLCYTVFYTIVRVVVFNMELSFIDLIKIILFGQAATPLYYVLVLYLFILITPVLVKCLLKRSLSILVYSLSFLTLICFCFLELSGYELWGYVKYTIVWLPFYYFGMMICSYNLKFDKLKQVSVVMIVVTLVMELLRSVLLIKYINGQSMVFSQIGIIPFLYAFVLAVFMFANHKPVSEQSDNTTKRLLVYLGDNSYGIYFIHYLYIMFFNVVFNTIPYELPLFIHRILECVLVILLSLLSIKILKVIFKEKASLLFGV